jgi:HK97 family phage prohead protease
MTAQTQAERFELITRIKITKSTAGERTITCVASTGSVDRGGDTIDQSGWKLDSYRKNPVILWAHDYTAMPIAKASKVAVENNALVATIVFPEVGTSTFSDKAWALVQQGVLNAVSVGFVPLSFEPRQNGGLHFTSQELLEISIVPVPANSQALLDGRPLVTAGRSAAPGAASSGTLARRLLEQGTIVGQAQHRAARTAKAAAADGRPRLAAAARSMPRRDA